MIPENLHLLPRLAARIEELLLRAHTEGIQTAFPHDSGLRATAKQWEKFKQGRKQLPSGLWAPIDPVHRHGIVTNAQPSKAPHCRHIDFDTTEGSAACDVAIVVGEKIAWNKGDPGYDQYPVLGHLAKRCGLAWGGDWVHLADLDHFELPEFRELEFKEDQ